MNDYKPINDPKEKKAKGKIWLIFYIGTFIWMYFNDGQVLYSLFISIPASVIFMLIWFVVYEVVIEPILDWIKN